MLRVGWLVGVVAEARQGLLLHPLPQPIEFVEPVARQSDLLPMQVQRSHSAPGRDELSVERFGEEESFDEFGIALTLSLRRVSMRLHDVPELLVRLNVRRRPRTLDLVQ